MDNTTLINALQRRYATKTFDAKKKISPENIEMLYESVRLAPSSFGLQPRKLLHVKTDTIKQSLLPHTRNQSQVVDASDLFVLARPTKLDALLVDNYLDAVVATKNVTRESLSGYADMMYGFVNNSSADQMNQRARDQIFIALGFLLETCALLHIDACPIGGFVAEEYDTILGLKEQGLTSVVVCPVGYRSDADKYAAQPKVRYDQKDVVIVK